MDFCTQIPDGDELFLSDYEDSSSETDSGSESDEEEFESGSDSVSEEESQEESSGEDSATYSDDDGSDSGSDADSNASDASEPLALAIASDDLLWPTGKVLRVRFLAGSHPDVRAKVEKYAKQWTQYANISFRFTTSSSEPSDIRIAFHPKGGHNSYIGTGNENVPEDKHTMNLAINRNTPENRVRRVVLHEFGHVLGCIHEHSSPAAKVPWNEKKVYAHYAKQGWSRKQIDRNVLKPKHNVTQFSKFDKKSIMIYAITTELTTGGFRVPWNTVLSQTDKAFIAMMYPPAVIKCNYCKKKINVSRRTHKFCEKHRNYLCEGCYNTDHRRRQTRAGTCSYVRPPVSSR